MGYFLSFRNVRSHQHPSIHVYCSCMSCFVWCSLCHMHVENNVLMHNLPKSGSFGRWFGDMMYFQSIVKESCMGSLKCMHHFKNYKSKIKIYQIDWQRCHTIDFISKMTSRCVQHLNIICVHIVRLIMLCLCHELDQWYIYMPGQS